MVALSFFLMLPRIFENTQLIFCIGESTYKKSVFKCDSVIISKYGMVPLGEQDDR